MVGSIAGLAIGLPVPVVGSFVEAVLGGAAGAFVGAYVGEAWKGRDEDDRIAVGGCVRRPRCGAPSANLAAGAIMLVIVAWDAFI